MNYHAQFHPMFPTTQVQATLETLQAKQLEPPEGGPWRVHTVHVVMVPTQGGRAALPMLWCLWEQSGLPDPAKLS